MAESQNDRFTVTEASTNDYKKQIFEFNQKSIVFDSMSARLIIIKDITQLVNNEYARSINKISELMIASTSHDMRTPLNTTQSMLTLLENTNFNTLQKKWVGIAKASLNLLLFLINDTLDYYQIKSGKFKTREDSFCVNDLIESAFQLFQYQMEKKHLNQIVKIDQSLYNLMFLGDKQRLCQVLVNLIANSLKFTF